MILIVCAMENESKTIRESLKGIEVLELTPEKYYYKGKLKNQDVCLVTTGIGKVNAAALTSLVLSKESFSHIINIGYAGGVKPYKIGDVVLIKDASYHDVDVTSANSIYEYGQIPNMPHPFLSDYNLLKKFQKELKTDVLSLYTGDKFMNELFFKTPGLYDMEGAAIYQVAHIFMTPIISIKIVSDIIDSKTQNQDYSKSEKELDVLIKKTIEKIIKIKRN